MVSMPGVQTARPTEPGEPGPGPPPPPEVALAKFVSKVGSLFAPPRARRLVQGDLGAEVETGARSALEEQAGEPSRIRAAA